MTPLHPHSRARCGTRLRPARGTRVASAKHAASQTRDLYPPLFSPFFRVFFLQPVKIPDLRSFACASLLVRERGWREASLLVRHRGWRESIGSLQYTRIPVPDAARACGRLEERETQARNMPLRRHGTFTGRRLATLRSPLAPTGKDPGSAEFRLRVTPCPGTRVERFEARF